MPDFDARLPQSHEERIEDHTVYAGDIGVTLTLPIQRDGSPVVVADVTASTIRFQPPSTETATAPQAVTLSGTTASEAVYTTVSGDESFTSKGRWRVRLDLTFADGATGSAVYGVEVREPIPVE